MGLIKQMDAYEFVSELEGGWDTIIWDPPYLKNETATVENAKGVKFNKNTNWAVKIVNDRLLINERYLAQLESKIFKKNKNKPFFWLTFFNKPLESTYRVNWYKGERFGGLGGYVIKNTEYIMIQSFGNIKPKERIYETIHIPYHSSDGRALSKPIQLYELLLKFCGSKYILDPFAGSYNSFKACRNLGIDIDTCDKYEKPNISKNIKKEINKWV